MVRKNLILLLLLLLIVSHPACNNNRNTELKDKINKDEYLAFTKQKALEIMKTGFNAGDGYREVWIRDYNTFIELSSRVFPSSELKENLLVFFRMQGEDGNIIDGFTPIVQVGNVQYDFIYSDLEPRYAGHKNTVETDQESSLIQAVYKYIMITADSTILQETIGGKGVGVRMVHAMEFLMNHRFNSQYGLIIGATTADWGDVQPEHGWGVDLDNNTHPAIDIYDNAMFIIALDNLMEIMPETKERFGVIRKSIAENCRKHLWDEKNQKFIPHIYLDKGSPFPPDFDENKIFYFGGTAIAIEAGLLSRDEIKTSLDEMVARVKEAGAPSIGLTLYPPYPEGYFANKIMNPVYSYQNGGDWTWFGGRMIQQLIKYGYVSEAYEQVAPMVKRVKDNNGFYEWYSIDNKPRGSGTFRGEAGVLYKAITMFEEWSTHLAAQQAKSGKKAVRSFQIPKDYLREAENIPSYWISEYDCVTDFLVKNVHKGKVEIIGTSAGGRPIRAVFYGTPRQGKGTTTFSGSLGFGDVKAYRGPDHEKTVYMGMAAVHGGEFEGIVGMVNLISVIETGKDLRGLEWPGISAIVSKIDRLILIPIVNPDGRVRIPLRMELFRDTDFTVAEYLNTGGNAEGKITGWPQIKEFIPMDFSKPGFPGGYPNDAGVNIQHDDFFGKRQPETQVLFDLTEREKPDLIINLHTGAVYMRMDRPLGEPALHHAFDTLFRYVHSELGLRGFQYSKDPKIAGDPALATTGVYNLDGALNFHCGALSLVVESPSHSFDGLNEDGKPAGQKPDMLLDAQLICHQQAMRFLAETGGRSKWLPGRKR